LLKVTSPTGYKAVYKRKKGFEGVARQRVVQSWSADGEPQVVHNNRLVSADSIEGFMSVETCLSVAGVAPGGDWVQEWCLAQEKEAPQAVWPIPVISWIVTSDGEAEPVIPNNLWPGKDYKGQAIDWDTHGMASVRTLRSPGVPKMAWRQYSSPDTESEPWPAEDGS
jgi:hypothetical protein